MTAPKYGTLIAGRYRLTRKIGRGGMGTVWAADDTNLRRSVAVKMMSGRVAGDEKALQRFEHEAMAVARLRSPHIVEVYDYGIHDERPFMVMELLQGEALSARLRRAQRLDPGQLAPVVQQIGKALSTAHHDGIAHRDLKPGNIFLIQDQDEERIKVFDFGIAKALTNVSRRLTTKGEFLGTPQFMSPEQLRGDREVDERTDLWSLGVIMYRALTGAMPFRGEDIGELIDSVLHREPPASSTLQPQLSRQVDEFFRQVLAKDPARRFQSARELIAAFLEAVELGDATSASPAPLATRDAGATGPPPASTPIDLEGGTTATTVEGETIPLIVAPPPARRRWRWLGALAALALGGVLAVLLARRSLFPTERGAESTLDASSEPGAAQEQDSIEADGAAGPVTEPAPSSSTRGVSGAGGRPATGTATASASARTPRRPPKPPSASGKGQGDSELFSEPWW